MVPQKKMRWLRYGIAADLVIVATGVALLLPRLSGAGIVALYAIVVAVSAAKGGWEGALAATALATVALLSAFRAAVSPAIVATFVATGIAIARVARHAKRPRTAAAPPLATVVAFPETRARREREPRSRRG